MKTNTSSATGLIQDLPVFVSREELDQVAIFETELSRFTEQEQSVTVPFLQRHLDAAVQKYQASPSGENFTALKVAAANFGLVEKLIFPPGILDMPRLMRDRWVRATVLPFVERGLRDAVTRRDQIAAEEAQRHEKLTGEKLAHSPVAEFASRPVNELTRLAEMTRSALSNGGVPSLVGLFSCLRRYASLTSP